MLNSDQKKILNENGYLIIPKQIDENLILNAQKSFCKIKEKAKNGLYPFIRVYDDYSFSKNIAGIEMTFHNDILDQQMINFIEKSNIIEYAKSVLGDDIELDLSRYHLTENFSHVGIWHRDEKINHNNQSIQINVFLYDETGLQVVEKSHKQYFDNEHEIKKRPYSSYDLSKWIDTKAGEVLIFDPAVLHRAISEKPRANIHFRFKKKTENLKNPYFSKQNKILISDEWKKILARSPNAVDERSLKKYRKVNNLKSIFMIICRRIIHNLIFFLPLKSIVYRAFDVRPNLFLRRLLRINS